jgi:hypothetical protein
LRTPILRVEKAFKYSLMILSSFSVFVLVSWVFAQQAQKAFETQDTIIFYHENIQLQKMNLRIRFTPPEEFVKYYSFKPDPPQNAQASGLAVKTDGMLYKVCHILPACPASLPTLRIYLLKDAEEVSQRSLVFSPFYGSQEGHEGFEGLFLSRENDIFLSLEDLREGILAHEMAHFILCQYIPLPPRDVQERWARYVESEL